jgi:hypothetical protein
MTSPGTPLAQETRPRLFSLGTALQDALRIALHPAAFYEKEALRPGGRSQAMGFLLLASLAGSLPGSLLVADRKLFFFAVFFANAFLTPVVLTALLRLVTPLLCKGVFTAQHLFRITAYAQVTLLVSWIPGAAWMAGLWKFFLIGMGLVHGGRIRSGKAAAVLAAALLILLLLLRLVPLSARF